MSAMQWMLSAVSSAPWASTSSAWEVALRVAAAVAIIAFTGFVVRRWGQAAAGRLFPRSRMRVIDGVVLGPQRGIYLVRVGRRGLVVGVTPQQVNLLLELPADETDELDVPGSTREEPFSNVFRRYFRPEGTGSARESSIGGEDRNR